MVAALFRPTSVKCAVAAVVAGAPAAISAVDVARDVDAGAINHWQTGSRVDVDESISAVSCFRIMSIIVIEGVGGCTGYASSDVSASFSTAS